MDEYRPVELQENHMMRMPVVASPAITRQVEFVLLALLLWSDSDTDSEITRPVKYQYFAY